MKKVYYIDVNCDSCLAQGLVNNMNEKVSRGFHSRTRAIGYLKYVYHYLKERFGAELESLKKHCKEFGASETITIDVYKGIVNNKFDFGDDNFFEDASGNYHIIDSRYLLGRY